jgi:hypothetical protein
MSYRWPIQQARERVDLAGLEHVVEREFRFNGGAVVRFGTTKGGWFAWHSRKGPAWVFTHERSACDLADQWLARGSWAEQIPVSRS